MFFSSGDRRSVPNVGIVVTDGYSNSNALTKTAATAAKNAGITLYAVGKSGICMHVVSKGRDY